MHNSSIGGWRLLLQQPILFLLYLMKVKVKMVNLTTIAKDRKGVILETND